MFKSSTARTDAASSRGVLLPPDLQLMLLTSLDTLLHQQGHREVKHREKGGKEGRLCLYQLFVYM